MKGKFGGEITITLADSQSKMISRWEQHRSLGRGQERKKGIDKTTDLGKISFQVLISDQECARLHSKLQASTSAHGCTQTRRVSLNSQAKNASVSTVVLRCFYLLLTVLPQQGFQTPAIDHAPVQLWPSAAAPKDKQVHPPSPFSSWLVGWLCVFFLSSQRYLSLSSCDDNSSQAVMNWIEFPNLIRT